MTYRLKFLSSAKKEWDKLDSGIQSQFKNKLRNCLENPHIPAKKLNDFDCAYKIKLRSAGYRLVYEVDVQDVIVFVIAVGNGKIMLCTIKQETEKKPDIFPVFTGRPCGNAG